MFFAALALQGILGGTFAASNAYLAMLDSGPALARNLTAMQWSARAALVVAPVAIGLVLHAATLPIIRCTAGLPCCRGVSSFSVQ